jgi:hypothetical protein
MPSSVRLRDDYDAAALRELAKRSRDLIHRLSALAAVYDGMSRADAAKVGGWDTLHVEPDQEPLDLAARSEGESNRGAAPSAIPPNFATRPSWIF